MDFRLFLKFAVKMSGDGFVRPSGESRCLGASLTDFDTPGQFLTMEDKIALFLAVSLKKVRVL